MNLDPNKTKTKKPPKGLMEMSGDVSSDLWTRCQELTENELMQVIGGAKEEKVPKENERRIILY